MSLKPIALRPIIEREVRPVLYSILEAVPDTRRQTARLLELATLGAILESYQMGRLGGEVALGTAGPTPAAADVQIGRVPEPLPESTVSRMPSVKEALGWDDA